MRQKTKGSIRRSQLITTYGVGSIVPAGDESFMVAGLNYWNVNRPDVHEPRLERNLEVQGFVLPPASEDGPDVPVVRFPSIYYCPECKRLDRHSFFTRFDDNKCNLCNVSLVPSRFVVACSCGHIDDFPYFEWVHKGTTPNEARKHDMRIEAGGVSASLSDIVISCSCGKSSTMWGAFAKHALKDVKKCTGRRPWLGDIEDCEETPRTLQRGASNVYFAVVRSSLSIPPWSEGAFKILNRHWNVLKAVPNVALEPTIEGMQLAKGTSYTAADLVLAVKQRKGDESEAALQESERFREDEYEALVMGKAEVSAEQDFVCVPANDGDPALARWLDKVMAVKRLREVRALQGFTRLLPLAPGEDTEVSIAPLSKEKAEWLPAIEVMGEGVFLRLEQERLHEWENRTDVRARAERIDRNYRRKFNELGTVPDRVITPRLILVHTLTHALIGQWALDAGYPASSLRERLYVSGSMCGLLIYTATSDAAGSLGGVVAQVEGARLAASLEEAVLRASWCSGDPLCIEADATGVNSLNLGACHACVLLPEVSCEHSNVLLDRGMLVGTTDEPGLGYFAPLLERI